MLNVGFAYFCFNVDEKGVHGPEPWACICCHADDFCVFLNKKLPKILFETKFVGTYCSLFQACFVGEFLIL